MVATAAIVAVVEVGGGGGGVGRGREAFPVPRPHVSREHAPLLNMTALLDSKDPVTGFVGCYTQPVPSARIRSVSRCLKVTVAPLTSNRWSR
ncbi:hypothetical protein E2C01_082785 [Portunus trituberculatus]|uniref:Uncharacterized protein n=1 Tax=Portunus trituberculatus TaxID=210409 RepID=A0A5B7IZD7_PORTR|nr:hypothetical protein [Portunus trituberculatus]